MALKINAAPRPPSVLLGLLVRNNLLHLVVAVFIVGLFLHTALTDRQSFGDAWDMTRFILGAVLGGSLAFRAGLHLNEFFHTDPHLQPLITTFGVLVGACYTGLVFLNAPAFLYVSALTIVAPRACSIVARTLVIARHRAARRKASKLNIRLLEQARRSGLADRQAKLQELEAAHRSGQYTDEELREQADWIERNTTDRRC